MKIYTIGHSNRSIEDFVAMLDSFRIDTLVDVRTMPRSRTNPQFNIDSMPASLAPKGVEYVHEKDLGGLRGTQAYVGPNDAWENGSFRNYADYALTPTFHTALNRLIQLSRESRCAIMCAEAVWWKCHRRIITDHLIHCAIDVEHILDTSKSSKATIASFARVSTNGQVTYPAHASAQLKIDFK